MKKRLLMKGPLSEPTAAQAFVVFQNAMLFVDLGVFYGATDAFIWQSNQYLS